jgi:protein CpxP
MKKFLWIVAVAMSLALGQTAFADSDNDGCGSGMKKMVEVLDLTKEQKEKVMPMLDQLKMTIKGDWAKIKDLRQQINAQVESDKMDQATLDGLLAQKEKIMTDMMKAKVMTKHQMFMMITPEQKVKYSAMMKKWEGNMMHKMEACREQE